MQSANALLLDGPVRIGNSTWEGKQAFLPVVAIRRVASPSKKSKYFKVDLTLFIPTEGCPSQADCNWLMPGAAGSALQDLQVVMFFKAGTMKVEEPQP